MGFLRGLALGKTPPRGGWECWILNVEFWMLFSHEGAKTRRREDEWETGRAVVSAAGAFFGLWFVEGDERCFF
jgi:hypothetical protein